MKIPTRSGGKMLINDIFDEVLREKEVLTDVTGKTPTDIKFDRHGGGFMDQLLMGVARDVFFWQLERWRKLLKRNWWLLH
jgi:hypothetical protein